jgi:hypothetical protein
VPCQTAVAGRRCAKELLSAGLHSNRVQAPFAKQGSGAFSQTCILHVPPSPAQYHPSLRSCTSLPAPFRTFRCWTSGRSLWQHCAQESLTLGMHSMHSKTAASLHLFACPCLQVRLCPYLHSQMFDFWPRSSNITRKMHLALPPCSCYLMSPPLTVRMSFVRLHPSRCLTSGRSPWPTLRGRTGQRWASWWAAGGRQCPARCRCTWCVAVWTSGPIRGPVGGFGDSLLLSSCVWPGLGGLIPHCHNVPLDMVRQPRLRHAATDRLSHRNCCHDNVMQQSGTEPQN